jgi:hypothetical protein
MGSTRATISVEAIMAVIFVLLAILTGIAVGDAVLENKTAETVTLFNQSITGLTFGQFLAAAAAVGFALMLFLVLAGASSRTARRRRKELRANRRDLDQRLQELERENASLRDQLATRNDELTRRATAEGDTGARDREAVPDEQEPQRQDTTAQTRVREPVGRRTRVMPGALFGRHQPEDVADDGEPTTPTRDEQARTDEDQRPS